MGNFCIRNLGEAPKGRLYRLHNRLSLITLKLLKLDAHASFAITRGAVGAPLNCLAWVSDATASMFASSESEVLMPASAPLSV